jgi:hypothetical protein
MNSSDLIDEYDLIEDLALQKLDGRAFSDIREELKRKGHSQEDINSMIRAVDDRLFEKLNSPKRKIQWGISTIVVTILSLIIAGFGINWIVYGSLGLIPLLAIGGLILKLLGMLSSKSKKNIKTRKRYFD